MWLWTGVDNLQIDNRKNEDNKDITINVIWFIIFYEGLITFKTQENYLEKNKFMGSIDHT